MENVIECRNLTHYYGNRMIYENLSFTVPRGRILGLLGKKRHRQNDNHQYSERLFTTSFGRVSDFR